MRIAAACLVLLILRGSASAVDVGAYAQDIGGGPVPVGAGPRALGMGGAFTAIADDATANTWNPGGMVQLERPEIAVSGAFHHDQVSLSNSSSDHASAASLEHVSLIAPFFLGFQQTIGLAWQRQYDFTRSVSLADLTRSADAGSTLTQDDHITIDQDGGFASVGASYAVEPVPGLGLGVTAHSWADDWTAASRYHRRQRESLTTQLDFTAPPITLLTHDEIAEDRTTTVKEGYSFVIGAWWQATPALTVAATVKPHYTLRLASEGMRHQVTTDVASGAVIADDTVFQTSSSKFTFPTTANIGFAWRMRDEHTFAVDLGWTRWSEYRIEQDGSSHSPIDPLIDPKRFSDGYAVRLGYEHLSILPSLVLVQRVGASYEGLPGVTRVADPSQADTASPTIDRFYSATAGISVCLRDITFDLSAQLRLGNDVGAGQYASPDQSADVRTVTVVGGVVYQF